VLEVGTVNWDQVLDVLGAADPGSWGCMATKRWHRLVVRMTDEDDLMRTSEEILAHQEAARRMRSAALD
jgi:hypothetical protein